MLTVILFDILNNFLRRFIAENITHVTKKHRISEIKISNNLKILLSKKWQRWKKITLDKKKELLKKCTIV